MTSDQHPTMHPLDIPEIRDHLAQFLSSHTITVCARVSRDWHRSFHFRLWTSVKVVRGGLRPSVSEAKQHASFIRKLDIRTHNSSSWFTDLTLPNLTDLSLSRPIKQDQPEVLFLQRHGATLESLTLSSISDHCGDQVWTTLATSCTRLRSLSVHGAWVEKTQWPAIWDLWSRLKVLELPQGVYLRHPNLNEPMPWSDLGSHYLSTLTTLTLTLRNGMTVRDQIELVTHCPALKSLTWRLPMSAPVHKPLRSLVEFQSSKDHGSGLLVLKMDGGYYSEAELLLFLKMRRQESLVELSLQSGPFGTESWLALRSSHALCLSSLQVLHLRGCSFVDGPMVQDMLSCLSRLREFSAPQISSLDLEEDPRPWACQQSLQHLHLDFKLESRAAQRSVFVRLAGLQRLEVLKLGQQNHVPFQTLLQPSERERGQVLEVEIAVGQGLELLDPLKKLREFEMKVPQTLSSKEIEWMIQHWPALKTVRGQLNPDLEIQSFLSVTLDKARIEHWLV